VTMLPGDNFVHNDAEENDNIDGCYDHPRGKSKCLIFRVLNKLARYHNAGVSIARALLRMSCHAPAEIQILTTDLAITAGPAPASTVGVHKDGASSLLRHLNMPLLHEQSQQRLYSKWNELVASQVYVHGEL